MADRGSANRRYALVTTPGTRCMSAQTRGMIVTVHERRRRKDARPWVWGAVEPTAAEPAAATWPGMPTRPAVASARRLDGLRAPRADPAATPALHHPGRAS